MLQRQMLQRRGRGLAVSTASSLSERWSCGPTPSNNISFYLPLPPAPATAIPFFPFNGHNHRHGTFSAPLQLRCFSATSFSIGSVSARDAQHGHTKLPTPQNEDPDKDGMEEEGQTNGWEEEDEVEPEIGDGGDGGGIVLGDVPWGERSLSIAQEVLLHFNGDMKIFSFKATQRGYIFVRLDKLSNKYGCPSMVEIEMFSCHYKKRLVEVGEQGDIPLDLALEVSSPGAERLLKVPDDLERFKDLPMHVNYIEEDLGSKSQHMDGIFQLESIEIETGHCLWKLANVKENKEVLGKGRSLSRKQRDWRLRLPFERLKQLGVPSLPEEMEVTARWSLIIHTNDDIT